MDAREAELIAEQVLHNGKYELRTHAIVRVTGYDADKNLVQVQLVRKAVRISDNSTEIIELQPLSEVLVRQYGSGKLWCTVAPAVGSYGYLHISDRDIDGWKVAGGIAEPTSSRCMHLQDSVFEPSLLHLAEEGDNGLMVEPIKTDRISLRTRSGLTEISVLDDETIEVRANDTATLTIDTDGKLTISIDGGATLELSGKDGDTALTVGDGAVSVAIAEKLQQYIDNVVKVAFDTHVHPDAMGGTGPVATPLQAYDSAITSMKITIPDN